MNKLATVLFASIATAAYAGTPVVHSHKDKVIPPVEACFGETELQLDVFGAYTDVKGAHADGWGGGVGVNYYFQRYVGIGADYTVTDGEGEEVHQILGHLLFRLPIDNGGFCWAPYLKLGGGVQMDGSNEGVLGGGGGIEF